MSIKYRVKYTEHDIFRGPESWSRDFNTKQEALDEINDTNSKNTSKHTPDYYIIAEYEGEIIT